MRYMGEMPQRKLPSSISACRMPSLMVVAALVVVAALYWTPAEAQTLSNEATLTALGQQTDGVKPVLSVTDPPLANGLTLTLTYDEPLDATSEPAPSDFEILVNSGVRPVAAVVVSGSAVTLTLESSLTTGQNVTVTYTPGSNTIRDEALNDADALTNQPVTNETQLNILLITADDLNWDSVGAFGSPVTGATPNIDQLATEGIRFDRAHVTVAVCAPNRSVLMTGRYPHLSGGEGFHRLTLDGVPILPALLRSEGYTVGILNKVDHSTPYEDFSWDTAQRKEQLGFGRNPETFYQHAKTFVEGASDSSLPFFLMANSRDPHRAFYGNDPDSFYEADVPALAPSRTFTSDDVVVPGFLPDLTDVRTEVAEYYSSVRRLDDTVGRLLDVLDDTGVAENTIVMFLSDNGMPFPFAKANVYFNSTRTPWIVRWPGVVQSGSVDTEHFISSIDLMPTILDAIGTDIPAGVNGKTFLPLLHGEEQDGRGQVFTQFHERGDQRSLPMRSVQNAQFGYIYNHWSDGIKKYDKEFQHGRTLPAMKAGAAGDEDLAARIRLYSYRVPEELYHYESDPDALENLIDASDYADDLHALRTVLLEWMVETNDPLLSDFRVYMAGLTICDRTQEVEAGLLSAVMATDCALVPKSQLAAITSLDLSEQSISSLQTNDFDGLTSLTELLLNDNSLTTLPAGLFYPLSALTTLDLSGQSISSLQTNDFDGLTSLTELLLDDNSLTTLPAGLFYPLSALTTLDLSGQSISSLQTNDFDGLTSLTELLLDDNSLTTLPAGLFYPLSALTTLDLRDNSGLSYSPYLLNHLTSLTTLDGAAFTRPPAPGVPTGLTASFQAGNIELSWTAPGTGAATSYQILRKAGSDDEEVYVEDSYDPDAGVPSPAFTDAGVTEGETYGYRVRALNAGGASLESGAATFRIIPPGVPDQPDGTAVFIGGVDLEWNDIPGADSYEVQLGRGGQWIDLPGDGVEVAFYGAGAIISGLDPEASLWFQVRAANVFGVSDWSAMMYMSSTSQFKAGRKARPDNEPASGAPVVHGTAQVGENLWADASGIEDGNGLDRVQFRYQWTSNDGSADTDIAGATDSGYTLAAADVGRTIKVRVAFTDRRGYSETRTSVATGAVAAAPNNPATGAPAISGTAQVGETLTADIKGIADDDGLTKATYSYQWMAGWTDIPGATGSSYTLTEDDEGLTIRVWVGFTDDAGNTEALASAATGTVSPAAQQQAPNTPATGAPTISGTAQVGEVLTAGTTGIADADGLSGATFAYQWLADDVDISGATDATYTLVADDEGQTIKVRVTFTDDAENETTLTSAATEAVAAAPQPDRPATGEPTISGTAQVGEVLTVNTTGIADADGLTTSTYSYQWVASDGTTDTDIPDATDATYTLVADDEGQTIKVRVTFTDDAENETTLTSAATEAVAAAPQPDRPATGEPTISGTAQVGEVLTVNTTGIADADGLTTSTYSYQWVASDGTTDTDIPDATDATYTLVADDEGQTIKVRVTFTDDAENETTLTSAATEAVAAAPQPDRPATGEPTISGTAQVGHTLTVNTTGIADADGLTTSTYSYQWVASDGTTDTDIPDATDDTYTLVADDEGQTIKVRVTFTDDAENETTLTSAATEAVAAAPQPDRPATGLPTISGTAQVGQTLTVNTTGIADADGLTTSTYSYQWLASDGTTDTDIPDATDDTYTLVADDEGKTIQVRVSFTDDAENEETLTSAATGEVASGGPTEPPGRPLKLKGAANADGTVTLRWEAPDDDTVTGYQILRKRISRGEQTLLVHVNDTGSTATEYTDSEVTPDVLHAYRVKAINAAGLSKRSNVVKVTPVDPEQPSGNSAATGRPSIGGTPQVGETLTADTSGIGDDDGLTKVSYSYQWVVTDGGAYIDISGETGATYTLVSADRGLYIQVRVSFTDDAGNGETLTSAATDVVAAAP